MSNHVTDEERLRRMQRVYECVVEKNMSTRECANYLTKNEFSISNATVSDYIKRMAKLDPSKHQEERKIMSDNKVKTIKNNEEVRTRVKDVIVYLSAGYTFKEIADMLHQTEFTVYRDFSTRINLLTKEELKSLDITEETIKQIQQTLKEHSI